MDAITTCLLSSTLVGFCGVNDRMRIGTDGSADGYKLRHIKSPFAEFEFRYECLALTDALAQFNLCYAGVLSSLHKQLDHSQIKIGSK